MPLSASKAGDPSNQTGVVSGRPWASGWAASARTLRIAPGQKKAAGSHAGRAFFTGRPSCVDREAGRRVERHERSPGLDERPERGRALRPEAARVLVRQRPVRVAVQEGAGRLVGEHDGVEALAETPARTSRSWSVWYATPISFSKTNRVQPSSIDGTQDW